MAEKVVVKGRLVNRTTVELFEPVESLEGNREVEVLLPTPEVDRHAKLLALLEHLRSLPARGRSREDIDRQIQEERDSWE